MPVDPSSLHRIRPPDRPRERLLALGAHALSDAELLALMIGSGVSTRSGSASALAIARRLCEAYPTLRRMAARDASEWMQVPGMGHARAARLAAAFELGRRLISEPEGDRVIMRSPGDVAEVYGPRLRDLGREIFVAVLLNTAGVVIGDRVLSTGGLAASIVEPAAVFRYAVLENAASVLCVHNHPSGNPEPSQEDVRITRRLAGAGETLGIPLRDHVIIAANAYTSLAERGHVT